MIVWGIARSLDERLWLGQDGHLGSLLVQGAGIALAIGGVVLGVRVLGRWRAFVRLPVTSDAPESARFASP
jgi:hypothetical protein